MQHGSLQNLMAAESNLTDSAQDFRYSVGDGITEVCWTDRRSYTVVEVSSDGRTLKVQEDRVTYKPGSMGTLPETIEADPNGAIETVKLGAAGWRAVSAAGRYTKKGRPFIPGRSPYIDPHF